MMFKAAIFDMDGLLLDTENVCKKVFSEACQTLGVPFFEELYLSIIGCNAKTIRTRLTEGYKDVIDYELIHQEWRKNYDAVVLHQAIPVKKGAIALLDWLTSNNIPLAVATSTQRDVAEVKLKLAGLDAYFSNITTGCEVTHGKPHPEIYLLAAQRLGVEPKTCLAFEDSNNGVKSAMAATMKTYQILDLVEPCDEVRALNPHTHESLFSVYLELSK